MEHTLATSLIIDFIFYLGTNIICILVAAGSTTGINKDIVTLTVTKSKYVMVTISNILHFSTFLLLPVDFFPFCL